MRLLSGKRILVTRPVDQQEVLVDRLSALGAVPIPVPMIRIVPPADFTEMDAALGDVERYDWVVFTSVNGVRSVLDRARALGVATERWTRVRVAAVGPATRDALLDAGIPVAFTPAEYRTERLADGIEAANARVGLFRADAASPLLRSALRSGGAQVDEITAYRTLPAALSDEARRLVERGVDVITFTSPSTVAQFARVMMDLPGLASAVVACIGPVTGQAAERAGLRVDIQAAEYTIEGLIDALLDHYGTARAGAEVQS